MARSGVFKPIAICLGFGVILAILFMSIGQQGDEDQTEPAAAAGQQIFNTGNPQNDKLLALPADTQAEVLGKLVPDGCIGSRAFYQGMQKKTGHETKKEAQLEDILGNRGAAFWDVACTNGSSYIIEIPVDPNANTTSLNCALAAAVGGNHCFVRFPNQ